MSSRTIGLIGVALAAIAVVAVLVIRKPAPPAPATQAPGLSGELLDKMVVDYAYQTMVGVSKQAVAKCGVELAGTEADVLAHVNVEKDVIRLSQVKFSQPAWPATTLECVTKSFEGQERSPSADGVKQKFPEGGEYEVDFKLAFATPTLQYSE